MLIIGIAGGTGSGKTTVVCKITSLFDQGEVVVIPQDSYYMACHTIQLALHNLS
jgi:uridine kinase